MWQYYCVVTMKRNMNKQRQYSQNSSVGTGNDVRLEVPHGRNEWGMGMGVTTSTVFAAVVVLTVHLLFGLIVKSSKNHRLRTHGARAGARMSSYVMGKSSLLISPALARLLADWPAGNCRLWQLQLHLDTGPDYDGFVGHVTSRHMLPCVTTSCFSSFSKTCFLWNHGSLVIIIEN